MAFRIDSRSCDAGNKLGHTSRPLAAIGTTSLQLSISARDIQIPLTMPDIRLQAISQTRQNYRSLSTCGRSPYTDCWASMNLEMRRSSGAEAWYAARVCLRSHDADHLSTAPLFTKAWPKGV